MGRGEDVSSPQQPRFRLPTDMGTSWFRFQRSVSKKDLQY